MGIILASGSPRRHAILTQIGVEHRVVVSEVDESLDGILPLEAPAILASRKACAVSLTCPGDLVLGFDTLVFRNRTPLGKPRDAEEASHILWSLRDRRHQVVTGFAAYRDGFCLGTGQESTWVRFRAFSKLELVDYIASGEPFDKAGAYGIQGKGARLVRSVEGCYYNVVGLPIARLLDLLNDLMEK